MIKTPTTDNQLEPISELLGATGELSLTPFTYSVFVSSEAFRDWEFDNQDPMSDVEKLLQGDNSKNESSAFSDSNVNNKTVYEMDTCFEPLRSCNEIKTKDDFESYLVQMKLDSNPWFVSLLHRFDENESLEVKLDRCYVAASLSNAKGNNTSKNEASELNFHLYKYLKERVAESSVNMATISARTEARENRIFTPSLQIRLIFVLIMAFVLYLIW